MKAAIDFSKIVKQMKPVNGVNCAPYAKKHDGVQRRIKDCFKEMHIPYSRLHDVEGSYGGSYFVDVSNIFRDFDADENDEKNYEFHYSDEYIAAIIEAGAQVVYRLGETIEWGTKQYRTNTPKDFKKWARICERIISHYNEGWANGFHYGIEYWEIWNEPENPPMWTGTKEEFFELYKVTATYLKKQFPKIKIGGYGSCGFYAVTFRKNSSFFQGVLQYYHDFLKMVKESGAPLDFFSWHLYSPDVDEVTEHAKYVRQTLDENGFTQTESHFNEWNVGGEGGGFHLMRNMVGASYIASALCDLQNYDYVDAAMYYVFTSRAAYNGFFDLNLLSKTCTYYAFAAFGKCYGLKNQVHTESNDRDVRLTAATDGNRGAAVLAYYGGAQMALSIPAGDALAVKRIEKEEKPCLLSLNGVKKRATVTISRIYEHGVEEIAKYENVEERLELAMKIEKNGVLFLQWE